MQYVLPGLSAFALSLFSIFLARRYFPKLGLMDRPHKYGLKREPIPYPGGILLYLVFLVLTLIFFEPTFKLMGLLAAGGLLVLVSFVDDRLDLSPWIRLITQVGAALVLVAVGIGIETITNPFGGFIALNEIRLDFVMGDMTYTIVLLSGLFTIAWIILFVNTVNWLDGIPGLVSGMTVIASLVLFFLSISDLVNQPEVATLAIMVAAMTFAFWLFDFHPPKILLGDSGSMFLGFLIAVMAIFSGGKIATAFLILGFAILDALYVIIYRLYKRKAPWKGGEWDKYRKAVHLHHRLLQFGLTERQVLLFVYVISAIFGVTALFLGTKGKFWAIVAVAAVSFVLGLVLRAKSKRGNS